MYIWLLDDSLRVEVYYDGQDREFKDNICISLVESCPEDERIFRAGETNIYLTPEQANLLALSLNSAIARSLASKTDG